MAAKRGRPSLYTPELAAEILDRLADGATLIAACRHEGMPGEATVRDWVREDRDGFSAKYASAREKGYGHMADDIVGIADGEGDPNRDRLRVDTRKWLLARALPKIYGDKLIHDGEVGLKVTISRDDAGVL
jgi:hypothetical protein